MAGIYIKDYKINSLQKDYNKYSTYFFNIQKHIKMLYNNHIININDKNSYFKNINDLLKRLNTEYNTRMMEVCNTDTESDDDNKQYLSDIFPMANLTNIKGNLYDEVDYLINLCKLMKLDNVNSDNKELLKDLFKDPFEIITKEILSISEKVGFSNVKKGLNMLIGESYEKFYEDNVIEKLNLINKLFICIRYEKEITCDKHSDITIEKIESINPVLMNNCAVINISKIGEENIMYKLYGYFDCDNLNIMVRTSQICHNLMYQKKKMFENLLNTRKDINDRFKKMYLRTINFCDLLCLTSKTFLEQIDIDYSKYRRLIGSPFMNLMKEFIKDDILNMFTIIKLLLLGVEENINVAGLLYGLTKDKKIEGELISNIIYQNLNQISQIKLRKAPISIKNELDKIKSLTLDDIDMKKQVAMCKSMPTTVKRLSLEKVEEMKSSNNEYYKQLLYVKTLLNYPWPSVEENALFEDVGKDITKSRDFLENINKKMDSRVYGHKECKSTITQIIARWLSNPSSSGSAIGLVGPPGVGKTLLAKGIGDALGIPFVQIALGGQNDGEILHGHGYTYSGAQPGMVIKKMIEAGSNRCVMYFDELDKACKKHDSNEIFNILIHMTDPNMNGEFQDRFFQEVKFPLNKVIFIFSYNDSSIIDSILLDRITQIDVKPYSLADKINIGRDFLMKEISDMVGFEHGSIIIKDEDLEFISDEYVYEAGVRDLKRKLETLFLKLNIDRIYQHNIFESRDTLSKADPIILDRESIIKYLDKPGISLQKVHNKDLIGVINGLYATTIGKGGIIPIQIFENQIGDDEKFMLKLTGSQGKVMRESVLSAFTTSINYVSEINRDKFLKRSQFGFHIHTPSAATPKDGPSAGCAFSTAFISRILNKKIRHDVAMTGEIELTGKVTKIGGLVYKLTGAKKAGVKLVLVSKENKEDLDKIKEKNENLIDDNFIVLLVDTLKDVLKEALVDYDINDFKKDI